MDLKQKELLSRLGNLKKYQEEQESILKVINLRVVYLNDSIFEVNKHFRIRRQISELS